MQPAYTSLLMRKPALSRSQHVCRLARPFEPRCEKTGFFAYAKAKTQISFAVTAKLISASVFATRIVQSLYFLDTKFQASSHLLWLHSLFCVEPGRKPRRPVFLQRGLLKEESAGFPLEDIKHAFVCVCDFVS